MGGPWTYDGGHKFRMHGPDKDFYNEPVAGIVGRGMYRAAGARGGTNPFAGPFSCSAVQTLIATEAWSPVHCDAHATARKQTSPDRQ
jgi:hypothetical protein